MITISTYKVAKARIIFPEGKVAERNPDRFCTVLGEFADAKGNALTIAQKVVTIDTAQHPDFRLVGPDAKGNVTLTLPSGKRGRKAKAGADAQTVAERLAALRK